jgi:hypothetical protein
MANDGRCNCNNGGNNDFQNLPSMLEQLLIDQAQLLRTMQQLLVQMQDVNQLMQSLEARPSSRKRKSNTQNDVGQHRRSMQPKRQHPIKKKVPRQLKQPQRVSIVDRLVILPIDAPLNVIVLHLHPTPTTNKF